MTTRRIERSLTNISTCYIEPKEYVQALQAASAATEEDKTDGCGWGNRGAAHNNRNQWTETTTSYEQALAEGGLGAKDKEHIRNNLQDAKEQLAAQQAKAAAKAAADAAAARDSAERAEAARLAAIRSPAPAAASSRRRRSAAATRARSCTAAAASSGHATVARTASCPRGTSIRAAAPRRRPAEKQAARQQQGGGGTKRLE